MSNNPLKSTNIMGIETIIQEIATILTNRKETLCTAESCTGGMLAAAFTSIPGASEYFKGGIISYTYDVKNNLLGVPLEDLEKYGAVRSEVALQMAVGAKEQMQSTYSISTTGVAGPGGGSPDTPVGSVWVGLTSPNETYTKLLHLSGDRKQIINSAREEAIRLFRDLLNRTNH
ncbi:CinA family protein [Falsiporphyromonas endometrii]|uniref:CinA family protein n=1 Tax=Falsiporphyromonas endometrii TaxID=1387297 RepID=UPI0036D30B23